MYIPVNMSGYRAAPAPQGDPDVYRIKKEGDTVVELDQFRTILNSYTKPLVEVRDSL